MLLNNNNLSRNLVYVGELFNVLENEDCEVCVSNVRDFEFLSALEVLAGKSLNLVFYDEDSCCPFCNSESNKNGRRVRYINRNKPVKIQKYVCSDENCRKFYETSLEKIVPKNANYAYKLRFEVIEQLLIDYSSLEKISEQIERIYGCKPSRQTVLNHQKETYETYYKNKIEEALKYTDDDLSGVYGL